MRTTADRIRHSLLFELIALLIVTPVGSGLFGTDMAEFGVIAVISASIAMLWNYVFNLTFDRVLLRRRGHTAKNLRLRVVHAVLFELGILAFLVPFIAWYLGIGLMPALVMDLSLSAFYVVYAFAFNWGYDVIFPVRTA